MKWSMGLYHMSHGGVSVSVSEWGVGTCWVRLPVSGWVLVRHGVHQCLSDESRTGAARQQQLLQATHTHTHTRLTTHTPTWLPHRRGAWVRVRRKQWRHRTRNDKKKKKNCQRGSDRGKKCRSKTFGDQGDKTHKCVFKMNSTKKIINYLLGSLCWDTEFM